MSALRRRCTSIERSGLLTAALHLIEYADRKVTPALGELAQFGEAHHLKTTRTGEVGRDVGASS